MAIVSVDLVAGHVPFGVPQRHRLQPPFPIDLPPGAWPAAHLFPRTDHVADKIAALYERHGPGASSRYKDLTDLVILALAPDTDLDGPTRHQALHFEVRLRLGLRQEISSSR